MDTLVIDKVVEQLRALPQESQWRVLEFTHSLRGSAPRGVPGRQLVAFAGRFPAIDLKSMSEAIQQGCEQVDSDEW